MGESNRDNPPPADPSIGDLIRSDEFKAALEAAREKRAKIQAERAKSGNAGKLRPFRPGSSPPAEAAKPLVLKTDQQVRDEGLDIVPLTPGMRVEPPRNPTPSIHAPALASTHGAAKHEGFPLGRTILASVMGIVIGFAAGAIVIDISGRRVSLPLPDLFGGGTPETAEIRPARNFELMADAPGAFPPSGADAARETGGEVETGLPSPSDVPGAPSVGAGAVQPDFDAAAPEPPFAAQAAGIRVAIFGSAEMIRADMAERLAALGVSDIESRPTGFVVDGTVVRYYRTEDAGLARGLARYLGASLQDLSSFRPQPETPRIDVWAGRG